MDRLFLDCLYKQSLRQVIKSLSTKKYPTLSEVAQITGISSRTLQRRLREAEVSYTQVINQIQFERAKNLLFLLPVSTRLLNYYKNCHNQ